ncbi:MAG: hypothetical protein LBS63_01615, partial [Prevotellaceae bacterium]|nr:hypothetical protein [Prevotellaceae bacterium]
METTDTKSTHSGYKFIIAILLVALACITVWYVRESGKWEELNQQISSDRDTISMRLNDMLFEYAVLETTNDSIQHELETEKVKIQTLLQKMRTAESIKYAEIRKYEQEANTLRTIMRSYIQQIDSLNTLSQQLLVENKEVKQSLQTSKAENEKLAQEKKDLSSQIERGSVLKVRGVAAAGLNSRDKDTRYASRTKKIKACFTINENTIAPAGERKVYLRLLAPDKRLLTNDEHALFEVGVD